MRVQRQTSARRPIHQSISDDIGIEFPVELSGDDSFEPATDLTLGLSPSSAMRLGFGDRVQPHMGPGDDFQAPVQLPVTVLTAAVMDGVAGRVRDRIQSCEGGKASSLSSLWFSSMPAVK